MPPNIIIADVDTDTQVRWYYATSGLMHFTSADTEPATLPDFAAYAHPIYGYINIPHAPQSEDAPDRLSDDPDTPAPSVGAGEPPF